MTNIVEKAEAYVFDLFKDELDSSFLYHNLKHTKRVLKSLREIIAHTDISEKDSEILQLSAIFHDTGYTKTIDDHEQESVKIAEAFLTENHVDPETIQAIRDCILATQFECVPKTLHEKIMRDADSSHFGKDYFNETSEFLRKELEIQGVVNFSASEWLDENIKMLSEKHEFLTDYAIKNWQEQKDKNLSDLISSKNKFNKKLKKEKLKAKYKAQYKNESPERGIQTFYRVALRNHIKLSDIADTKANILLSVNAIILSLIISNLFSKLDNPSNAYLIIPTIIFVVFSVTSIVLSVIATRPNVTRGEFTKEDVAEKRVNLTFFGNFHKMKLEEFEWAIDELLKDKNYVYSSLTKDLYYLGKVLDRKYRILRITYSIFMIGIIISVLAFAISFKMQNFNFL
ncbi:MULTISPECIES: Pycsar system effector family protein [Bizionia]|uniref:HD domain-containing protein n=1 Tax=Bizionia algoritergicola TaxID=291187 RepID=A0A5D0R2D7_9FLAO|nr:MULTISPECIES: Pycsar system effector family protein [Bizionia]OBX23047.1 phosphohydrolase [Bizionia sp. APA-3]TYB74704.1 HD domain-containing protein [Bizionia algoritergicola]